ncbi:RNA polymerase sigma24 factor [Asticcacaulis sp. AC460]|uniref:RNA polymerase sigma factor n=1 Tax=Asticcacaulis sp. AC460 TaxID=1282360 RepID=UPI0003C3C4FB|nr:RNA polymerase sigma factor [Asticcacaulis sp. AC460]ESQ88647.1 RNA polymerase sigma24 factor [Asticcacaulis sp. AC460]
MPETLRISLPPADSARPAAVARPETTRVNADPDETLLERIAKGDTSAVSTLVSRKLPRLLSLARRMLGDPVEAEDVAQETLVRTWKQARDWVPGKARIDTWMHRVALNLCYDRLRRRRDQVSTDDVEIVDTAAGPGAALERAQNAASLQTALKALPERQRVAITLCYYQELSNIEAAALMEVSVEALESLLSRARRSLRARLNPVEDKSGIAGSEIYPKPGAKDLDNRPGGA